ncbi:hypothetical protein MRX96_003719 [Rhipicephalus microplus]
MTIPGEQAIIPKGEGERAPFPNMIPLIRSPDSLITTKERLLVSFCQSQPQNQNSWSAKRVLTYRCTNCTTHCTPSRTAEIPVRAEKPDIPEPPTRYRSLHSREDHNVHTARGWTKKKGKKRQEIA